MELSHCQPAIDYSKEQKHVSGSTRLLDEILKIGARGSTPTSATYYLRRARKGTREVAKHQRHSLSASLVRHRQPKLSSRR